MGSVSSEGAKRACIELDELRVAACGTDQLLLDAFARARRRFRGAIVGFTDQTMISNTSGSELVASTDRRRLKRLIQNGGGITEGTEITFTLANGVLATAQCYPVGPVRQRVGVILHLSVLAARPLTLAGSDGGDGGTSDAHNGASPISPLLDPALLTGWCELTDSERSVADLVGRGLSNKEVGRRLFVSRHTVDSHLRHVFKKLGINSRVELARLLGEHYQSLAFANATFEPVESDIKAHSALPAGSAQMAC